MSLLKSIGKVLKGGVKTVLGSTVGGIIGGPVGAAIGGILSTSGAKTVAKAVAGAATGAAAMSLPVLPGVGAVARTALPAMAGAAGAMLFDAAGNPVARKRRRRKGLSAKDLSSFKRVARLVDKFSKPVHKMRNYKSKKEIC